MNWGTGFSACGEGDVGRLRAIDLHAPRFEPVLNCKKSCLQFMRGNGQVGVYCQDHGIIGEGCCGSIGKWEGQQYIEGREGDQGRYLGAHPLLQGIVRCIVVQP
jgi:hypothetical protein